MNEVQVRESDRDGLSESKYAGVTIGIVGYEIKQGTEKGKMTIDLHIDDPEQRCETYAIFLEKFEKFLDREGYANYLVKP